MGILKLGLITFVVLLYEYNNFISTRMLSGAARGGGNWAFAPPPWGLDKDKPYVIRKFIKEARFNKT